MVRSDDRRAAYFALLRAREELAALQRYEEYLTAERARLDAFVAAGQELDGSVDARLRRALRHTDGAVGEALELRRRVLAEERRRLPARLEAAAAYVEECTTAHAAAEG